jgi:hypothetical protein
MDSVAQYNVERWEALARNNAVFTRPRLDLDASTARTLVDPLGRLGDLAGAARALSGKRRRPTICGLCPVGSNRHGK